MTCRSIQGCLLSECAKYVEVAIKVAEAVVARRFLSIIASFRCKNMEAP